MLFFICHIYILDTMTSQLFLFKSTSFSKTSSFFTKICPWEKIIHHVSLLLFSFCLLLNHDCSEVVVLQELDTTYQSGLKKNYPLLDSISISKCNCIGMYYPLLAVNLICKPRIFFMPKTI